MKRYEEYKESGVKWIGKVPSHWKDCRFKNFVSLVNFPSTDENKIGLENIESGTGRFIETESEFEGNGVEYIEDDIVYGKLRPYLRKVWLATNKGNAVGDFFVFRAKRSNASYVKWLMLSDGFTSETNGSTFGAKMPRVSSDFILSLHYFLPPLSEQQSIASFLDAKTKPIDAIISKREKQIDLLEEMKSAIISRTVTKGLNPNAKMKDSGIEWIGEVPEGWNHLPFKVLFRNGKGLNITKVDLVDEGLPVISYGQIHSKSNTGTQLQEDLYRFVDESYLDDNKKCLVNQGDFIFADTSEDLEGIGNCVYIDKQITLFAGYHSIIAKSNNTYNNKYLAYLFKTDIWRSQLRSRVSGVKVFSLTQQILFSSKVILPSPSEQQAIVSFLDTKTSQIDSRIFKRRRQIELLQEYKQALITDAVTGKIDVREINS